MLIKILDKYKNTKEMYKNIDEHIILSNRKNIFLFIKLYFIYNYIYYIVYCLYNKVLIRSLYKKLIKLNFCLSYIFY